MRISSAYQELSGVGTYLVGMVVASDMNSRWPMASWPTVELVGEAVEICNDLARESYPTVRDERFRWFVETFGDGGMDDFLATEMVIVSASLGMCPDLFHAKVDGNYPDTSSYPSVIPNPIYEKQDTTQMGLESMYLTAIGVSFSDVGMPALPNGNTTFTDSSGWAIELTQEVLDLADRTCMRLRESGYEEAVAASAADFTRAGTSAFSAAHIEAIKSAVTTSVMLCQELKDLLPPSALF